MSFRSTDGIKEALKIISDDLFFEISAIIGSSKVQKYIEQKIEELMCCLLYI
jgi:hypothetical protein